MKPTFQPFAPSFRGLSSGSVRTTDPKEIVNILADHYENHFEEPKHDESNPIHLESITIFEKLAYLPPIPLEQIKFQEVLREWKKLPFEYLSTITILFNKCASDGSFFSAGKVAKVICLSKDGLYPDKSKLRPISLLPNIAKWFERIIHRRIIEWCHEKKIATDEQSGFMQGRRLQTRILSLVENLRLTVAACNRPALTIFVDFLSAFDRMWFPALIKNLNDLGMPLPILKWVHAWLLNRSLFISYGEENSRHIKMNVGAPQGSVLAATLFRLHVHFLPSFFFNISVHMFADDLALVFVGSLEKRFSLSIKDLEKQAEIVLKQLEKFSDDLLLPVNVAKTKALLVHSVVCPPIPSIEYKNQKIEYVKTFKYLGVYISTKLGWGSYIRERIRLIRTIPPDQINIRRKIFLAYAQPHFCWLFCSWFYFTENQKSMIDHVFCSGIRLVYSLNGWDDLTTKILSREKTLHDYIFTYWSRLSLHLEKAAEALSFQQSWQPFKIVTSEDKSWYRSMGFRKNSIFPNRLTKRARHTLKEWHEFEALHHHQFLYFKRSTSYLSMFVYKYLIPSN